MSLKYKIPAILALSLCYVLAYGRSFVHPGLLNSESDLERMKDGVVKKMEPVYSGFKVFAADPQSSSTYKVQGPLAEVSRNPTVGQSAYDSDANAAYQNAIMWYITGDKRHAEKAKEIINAWSATLKTISGKDAVLMAGLGPFKIINAAEIIRYSNAGWRERDIRQAENNFREVVYPVLKNFAPFANGNWDTAALKTVMAIAIFCNDRPMYERALLYYVGGDGDGAITNYIINDEGQCQESGRDQAHTQLGIAHLGDCCEMAWHQGLDLYGYADNRLLKGFEYTAKYNLGLDVPYTSAIDRTGKYEHKAISPDARGRLRPVYEQIYNHYAVLMGAPAPFTQQAAAKIRPELKGQPGADHPGFGTLLYSVLSRNPEFEAAQKVPAIPGGIVASGTETEIKLTWIGVVGSTNYIVERSMATDGRYSTVSSTGNKPQFVDRHIKKGNLYYYRVIAANKIGRGKASMPIATCAGLPREWKCGDKDDLSAAICNCDGNAFTLGVTGAADTDQLQGAFQAFLGDGEVIARFNPPVASQFAAIGLTIQSREKSQSMSASVLIRPKSTRDVEMPLWKIVFSTCSPSINSTVIIAEQPVTEPYVRWGRLMEPYWLKLRRKENNITAFVSGDGQSWTVAGSAQILLGSNPFVGIVATSGIRNVSSKVQFDHILVTHPK